jgi:hypothetical protein
MVKPGITVHDQGQKMKVADYFIASNAAGDDLAVLVKEHLAKGYELHGSPFSHQQLICQALILSEETKLKNEDTKLASDQPLMRPRTRIGGNY